LIDQLITAIVNYIKRANSDEDSGAGTH